MRNGMLLNSLVAFLIGSSVATAQTVARLLPPVATSDAPDNVLDNTNPNPLSGFFAPRNGSFDNRVWGNVEYLLWRFKDAPLPDTLVSSDFGKPSPEHVEFGGDGYTAGWQSGYRMTLGGWLDDDHMFGVEGSGFYFVPRTPTNFAMGAANPNQVLAIPFHNVTPGGGTGGVSPGVIANNGAGQSAFLISGGTSAFSGAPMTGAITVSSSTSLWGAELNGIMNLFRSNQIQLTLLGGFRYMDLVEDLYVNAQSTDPNLGSLATATFSDHFGTRNQFYGGQLGLKGEWTSGMFFVNAVAKVALGMNQETVSVNGSFSDPGPVSLNNFGYGPGGLLAQRSNIGQYARDRFMVLPETQLQVGLNLTRNVRLFAGYDFMYMSNVVRPGNQIDDNINLSQVGPNPIHGPNTLVGPASPSMPFQSSTFWAQGVTFGLEFRY